MTEEPTNALDLRDYLRIMRRRSWVIVVTTLLAVAAGLTVSLVQTPVYESQVRLVLEAVEADTGTDARLQQLVFGPQELETQREVLTSVPVAQIVKDELGLAEGVSEILEQVDAQIVGESQVLTLTATSVEGARAASIAQGFAEAYFQYRRRQALDQRLTVISALEERAQEVRSRLEVVADEREQARGTEREGLTQEENALLTQLGSIQAQAATLSAPQAFLSGGGQIIEPAEVPEEPASPKPVRTGVLAVVLGLMFGTGLAFLRDFLDDTVRSDEDASRAVQRPIIAHIPHWRDEGAKGAERVAAFVAPTSQVGEAYQTLRANLRFMAVARELRSVMITSAASGDGKTTTAANLAVVAARSGTNVILVGVDLRRPALHKRFEFDGKAPGLTDLLSGSAERVTDVLIKTTMPNLRVLHAGAVPPNPSELLSSGAMTRVMQRLEELADLVIYDGPPILPVADGLEIAPRLGGSLLVVNAGGSGKQAVRVAAERLRSVGAELVGVVLNNVPASHEGYQYAGYYYGDYSPDMPVSAEGEAGNGRSRRRARKAAAGS